MARKGKEFVTDVEFGWRGWPYTDTAWAEIESTMTVLRHNIKAPKFRDKTLAEIISWRRSRALAYYNAGLNVIPSMKKLAFVRNCPPPVVTLRGKAPQRCDRRWCPFCHARRVARTVTELQMCHTLLLEGQVPHKFVQLTATFEDRKHDKIDLCGGALRPEFLTNTMEARHCKIPRKVRKQLPGAFLGYSWFAPEPIIHKDERHGHVGHWRFRHGTVAVVPADWKASFKYFEVKELEEYTRRQAATLTARALRYPRRWMQGNVDVMAQALNTTSRMRMFNRFGSMRKACQRNNECQSVTTLDGWQTSTISPTASKQLSCSPSQTTILTAKGS